MRAARRTKPVGQGVPTAATPAMAMLIYPSLYAGRKPWGAITFNGIVDENIRDCLQIRQFRF